MKDPRQVAYNLIEEWDVKSTFPNLALKKALRSIHDERDRRFISATVYGVVERKITLDHFIKQCSDRKIERLSSAVLAVLRMGLYQMFYMDIPASAACNTSVELVKRRGMAHSAGFVNAVLRRADRERELLLALKKADFSVRYSIDPELVDLLLDQYGKEQFVSMMEGFQKPDTSIYLFHNCKRGDQNQFISLMNAEGVELEETDLPGLYKASHGFSVDQSPAFQNGWFHVVGRHSAEAALLMPKNTENAMDLCAAPGGKTFIMSSRTDGMIIASDVHAHKVDQLEKNAERLGHRNVSAVLADAAVLNEKMIETADFVLCDVPCSGLGIMGKKPDIKYKKYQSAEFTDLQYQILENGSRYLKTGGRLVYSTCTIDRRENELLLQRFLNEHKEFNYDDCALPGGYRVYLPEPGEDGFFIAVLKKGE